MKHRFSYVMSAVAMLASNACLLSPNDGAVMTTTSTVPFAGYTVNPNEQVQVEAFDGAAWVPIATAVSEPTPFNYDNTDLYEWGVNAVIPAARWRPGTTGAVAQVRARVGASLDHTATTFTPDWVSCRNANQRIVDFLSRCKSPRNPNAFLYTSDYPAGVDLTITNIAPAGGLDVAVRNTGRPGRITRLECFRLGGATALTVSQNINPLETAVLHITSLPGGPGTVTCTAFGVSENGADEVNTANNTRTQSI
jgi:hypothetical protein